MRLLYFGFVFLLFAPNQAIGDMRHMDKSHYAGIKRPAFGRETIAIQSHTGGRHKMLVEVARKPAELAFGLMKIKSLPGTEGMLFIMPRAQRQLFWMKDTLLPLDILFLASNGTITHIYPNAAPGSLDFIASPGIAKGVLEIEAGMASRWGLKAGDRLVHHKDFPDNN